jgi:SAM-dependent methyltransferase
VAGTTRDSVLAKYQAAAIEVSCPFCGSDDYETLVPHERYGTGFPTVICRRCCLIYLRRRWPDDVYRSFYTEEYRILDKIELSLEERYARQVARSGRVLDFCGPYFPGTQGAILDVGASTGGYVNALSWATGCRVIGIEPSVEESTFARACGADVRSETLDTAGFDPASFDLVVLAGTIDHLFDPFGDLRRIQRLLRPGGVLYVSISDFLELCKLRRDPAQIDHLTYYTSETLRDLVQQLGFQVVRLEAVSAEEALRRHRDEREHVGPVLAMQALFRVTDEPVLFARPQWQRIKSEYERAWRRYHERPPVARRVLRRLGAISDDV